MTTGDPQISYDAPSAVRAVLERVGRTEDVSFSPDNRRLALAGFASGSVAILDVEITMGGDGARVTITEVAELSSPGLNSPHGVEFLDDETLVVANRGGDVTVLRLPPGAGAGDLRELTVIEPALGRGFELLSAPGSLTITRGADGGIEVLICNNLGHTVTTHALHDGATELTVTSNDVLVRRWLDVPDGVAVSPDGGWLAVSNHIPQVVMLYERSPSTPHQSSDPDGILRGASYPHGLRFSADARHLFVADAGTPYVHVYERHGETWRGVHHPAVTVRVMDDEVFQRGRHNPQEGGPKGIDIDRGGHVLAVTSECRPLAFFDVAAILGGTTRRPDPALQMRYELEVLEQAERTAARANRAEALARDAQERAHQAEVMTGDAHRRAREAHAHAAQAAARARAAEAHVAALERTKLLRITRPLRRIYANWLTKRR